MTVGQTIEAKIVVDGKQAIAEIAKFENETKAAEQALRAADAATKAFEKAQRDAIAAVTQIDQRIAKYERDIVALATAMASGKGNTKAYEAEMRQLSRELDVLNGKTKELKPVVVATAKDIKEVGSAGNSAAQRLMTLSQAADDAQYGFRGVLNNIPQIVAAFGGTMGLAGGISIAATALYQIYDRFIDVGEAAEKGTQTAGSYVDDLRKEISDLSDELTELQGTATKVALEEQGKRIGIAAKEAQAMIDAVGGRQRLDLLETMTQGGARMDLLESRSQYMERDIVYRTRNPFVSPEMLQQVIEAREKLDLELSKLAAMKRVEQEKEDQKQIDAAIEAANEQTRREQDVRDKAMEEAKRKQEDFEKAWEAGGGNVPQWKKDLERRRELLLLEHEEQKKMAAEKLALAKESVKLEFEAQEKALEEEQKAREKAQKDREKAEEKHLSRLHDLRGESWAERQAFENVAHDVQMTNLDRLRDHEWKTLKDRVEAQREFYNTIGDLATKSTELAINLGQDYIDARIEGAENAEAKVAAEFLKGIGNQLVGVGTKYAFEGAGMTLLGDPRGPLVFGLGVAATAAGIGMGAGGTAIAHTAAGGTVGQALPEDAKKDRGASPRTGGGGGSSGPFVLNISYGVGGPLPEDTAREIHRVMRTNDRRRGAA